MTHTLTRYHRDSTAEPERDYKPYFRTQCEVAAIMGLTRQEVDNIERRAIRKLRKLLEDER